MTRDEFRRGWGMLAAVYEREKPKTPAEEARIKARMEVYFDRVKALTSPEWESAIRRCLDVCRFFPTPAELLQAFNELGQKQRGAPEAEANEAFDLVAQSTVHALLHVQPQTFRCWVCRPSQDDAADPGCRNCSGRGTVRRKAVDNCSCTENRWDRRLLEERLGRAAAEGFVAAGGEGAFADLRAADPFVRKRFAEAYAAAVSVERGAGVPLPELEGSRRQPALPGSAEKIGREDAGKLLRLVSEARP